MLRKFVVRHAKNIIFLAGIIGVVSTNTGCRFIGHQPKEPESLAKMKR